MKIINAFFKDSKPEVQNYYKALRASFKKLAGVMQGKYRRQPWYLCLGHAESGVSTLVKKILSLDEKSMLQCHDEAQFAWHISSQATIFQCKTLSPDIFCGITPEHPILQAFIKLIGRWRYFRSLNGLIVVIDIAKINALPMEELQLIKQQLQAIIEVLHQYLKISIPAYLLCNKSDLLLGFNEFFADLALSQQQQVWGINFAYQDFANQQQLSDYFYKHYAQLLERLESQLMSRLIAVHEIENRKIIFYFPQQIAACQEAIATLLINSHHAKLRGIYFTSNQLGGDACDFVMQDLAARYHLQRKYYSYKESSQSHFIKSLLPAILLPEADLIYHSCSMQSRRRYLRNVANGLAGILLAVSVPILISCYQSNINAATAIREYLPAYQQALLSLPRTNQSIVASLPILTVVDNMAQVYSANNQPWLLYATLYQPISINHLLQSLWHKTLVNILLPRVQSRLAYLLTSQQRNPVTLYDTLKAYLYLVGDKHTDSPWLLDVMKNDWARTLSANPVVQSTLNAYLYQATQFPVINLPANQKLITQTRKQLYKVSPEIFAYHELKHQILQNRNDSLNLSSQNNDFDQIFACQKLNDCTVPSLFTLAQYEKFNSGKAEFVLAVTSIVNQILGLPNNTMITDEMTPKLWQDYNNDYINAWHAALNNIAIVHFENYGQAVQVLNKIIQHNNALLQTLWLVKANTIAVRNKNISVADDFADLNHFSGLPTKSTDDYNNLIKNLAVLRDYLQGFMSLADPAKQALQDASAIMQHMAPTNPLVILAAQAQQLPFPINHWVNEIVANSYRLLLQDAHQAINAAWQTTVWPIYQSDIQHRFPFSRQPDTYVSLSAFGNFFGYQGIIDQFMQNYLQPFIDLTHENWSLKSFAGLTIPISAQAFTQLQSAAMIKKMFFANNDKNPQINFSLQPRWLDAQTSNFSLMMGNQSFTYRHGPLQMVNWQWPAVGNQMVSYTFNDFQGNSKSQTFSAPWAWFVLLATTQPQAVAIPGRYLWNIKTSGHQISFDLWTANNLPVFSIDNLNQFSLPNSI